MNKILIRSLTLVLFIILIVPVSGIAQYATMFAAGGEHVVAVNGDGTVYAWGTGLFGEDTWGEGHFSPIEVQSPTVFDPAGLLSGKTSAAVTSGGKHSLILTDENELFILVGCTEEWDLDLFEQVLNCGEFGDSDNAYTAVAVDMSGVLAGKTISMISAGGGHNLVLTSDNGLYAWGANESGQLGDGSTTSSGVPVAVDMSGALSGKTVSYISAGSDHNLIKTSDGGLYTWGGNSVGQLGNNSTTDSSIPVAVDLTGVLSGKTITDVDAGVSISGVVTSDGGVFTWGQGGLLGDGTSTSSSVPITVDMTTSSLTGKTVTDLAAGSWFVVLAGDGTLHTLACDNVWGAAGNGTYEGSISPTAVDMTGVLAGKTFTHIDVTYDGFMGSAHARASDGSLYAWGSGRDGQLGNATGGPAEYPVATHLFSGMLPPASAATLSAPSDQSTTVALTQELSWGAVTEASGYMLNLGTDNPPTNLLNGSDLGDVQTYAPTLVNGTTYYWSVIAYNMAGDASTSSIWSFTTVAAPQPPDVATTPVPSNGATNVALSQDLGWDVSSGATGYKLSFGTDNPPTSILAGSDLGNVASYSPASLNNSTTYYWSVTPYNDAGDATGVQVWSFTTLDAPQPPAAATTPSPTNGATEIALEHHLGWAASAEASGYKLSFGTDNPPTSILNGSDLGNVVTYAPSSLSNSTTYYWSITPYNDAGDATGVEVWSFTTLAEDTPDVEVTMSALNGSETVPATGGTVSYSISIENHTDENQSVKVRLSARHSSGATKKGLSGSPLTITVRPDQPITRQLSQSVPARMPAGDYVLYAIVTDGQGTRHDSTGIEITKLAGTLAQPVDISAFIDADDWRVFYTDSGAEILAHDIWTIDGSYRADGSSVTLATLSVDGGVIPESYSLAQNFPNPFNPSTTIGFALQSSGEISLKLYSLNGLEIAQITRGYYDAGEYSISYTPDNLSSGTYLYVLETSSFREVKRMVYLK